MITPDEARRYVLGGCHLLPPRDLRLDDAAGATDERGELGGHRSPERARVR
jgi:hypothetical protein